MKTIQSSKDITTLELGDKVVFGDLEYKVSVIYGYYLSLQNGKGNANNNKIFKVLNISKGDFMKNLGIDTLHDGSFPEVKSLEALTAIVSALFKEYENQNTLPKTWEEFCKRNKIKEGESFIDCYEQEIVDVEIEDVGSDRDPRMNKNLCTSKQEAEAFLALMQLRQLRKVYVKNWEPDWGNEYSKKYNICIRGNICSVVPTISCQRVLSFPTEKLANQFLINFKDLLEIAKPLL